MDQAAIIARIDRLEYDFQLFELDDFIDHVARYQRREIVLKAFPLELTLSAAWVRGDEVDYIVYNDRLHVVQQRHNILHEIAHIVLNHRRRPLAEVLPPELLAQLAQLLPLAAQGRPRPTDPRLRLDPEEQEAEAFVLHIQQRLVQAQRLQALLGPSSSNAGLDRWVDSMAFGE